MSMLKKAVTLLVGDTNDIAYLKMPKQPAVKKVTERQLIQRESEIGRELFGPIPAGHHREFFCLDDKTCMWYEQYRDEKGQTVTHTTRYEIQGDKVLKAQDGAKYSYLEGAELKNLLEAVAIYYERVMRSVYGRDPNSGEPLNG